MRFWTKFWVAFLLFWVILGAIGGGMFYARFPFLVYFLVPFCFFGLIGAVPALFALLWMRQSRWTGRLALAGIYALLIVMVFSAPGAYRSHYEQPHNEGPYLSWAGEPATSMCVSFTTSDESRVEVLYKEERQQEFSMAAVGEATHFHHVNIEGLKPDTQYAYKVPALGETVYHFKTAPAGAQDFSFFAYGDTRPWLGLTKHGAVVQAMVRSDKERPVSFVANTGDIVESPGAGHGWQWRYFLRQIEPLAARMPYMVSLGNHEARGGYTEYERYVHFGQSPGANWYSFDVAGVHFVSISTQDPITPESPQFQWLVQDLDGAASTSRFVVALFHKPILTYDPRESYQSTQIADTLLPLFEKYGVDIAFTGHVHAYERHDFGAFQHVVTGGGGVMLWSIPEVGEKTAVTETTHHFCRIDVHDDEMHVQAIRVDGSVIDDFTVRRRDKSSSPAREASNNETE